MTAPTVNWNIPLWGKLDTIPSLEGVLNAQSNALDTALTTASKGFYLQYATRGALNLNTTATKWQHATVTNDTTPTNNGNYTWNGTAWIPDADAADITNLSAGWVSLTSGHKARIRRQGNLVTLHGAIQFTTGANYNSMFTVPTAFQPATTSIQFIGMAMTSLGSGNGIAQELAITNGLVSNAGSGYGTGSLPSGAIATLAGLQYWMD